MILDLVFSFSFHNSNPDWTKAVEELQKWQTKREPSSRYAFNCQNSSVERNIRQNHFHLNVEIHPHECKCEQVRAENDVSFNESLFTLREKSTFLHHKEMSSHFAVVFYGYSHSHLACLHPNQIKFGRDEICFHFKIGLTWCASELKFQLQWSQLSTIVNGKIFVEFTFPEILQRFHTQTTGLMIFISCLCCNALHVDDANVHRIYWCVH